MMGKMRSFFVRTGKELRYIPHVLFHPFDAFWDLKHEKRGSLSTVVLLLALWVFVVVCKDQFTGFILNDVKIENVNIFFRVCNVLLPFLIWCVANWCVTTLVDGKGTFGDIVMTTAYASVPYTLIQAFMIVFSNFITIKETAFYNIFNVVSLLWFAMLFFCGLMMIHDFSVGKTLLTIVIAALGMVVIVFLIMLFLYLMQSVTSFVVLLFHEFQLHANQ